MNERELSRGLAIVPFFFFFALLKQSFFCVLDTPNASGYQSENWNTSVANINAK